jgi:hypothetical protein
VATTATGLLKTEVLLVKQINGACGVPDSLAQTWWFVPMNNSARALRCAGRRSLFSVIYPISFEGETNGNVSKKNSASQESRSPQGG